VIKATVGEIVAVDLQSTPGTGYRWQIADLPNGIESVDAGFTAPANGPGAGGTQHFHLRATRSGNFALKFVLKRSWEAEAIDNTTIEVQVT
jgi:predicted secreted protein